MNNTVIPAAEHNTPGPPVQPDPTVPNNAGVGFPPPRV